MNVLLKLCITVGITLVILSGYQWWIGSSSVLPIDAASHPPLSVDISSTHEGEYIADLKIPALEKKFKVYWGTAEDSLNRGVGMFDSQYTTAPDKEKHTVLSGHRDTVFTELGTLEEGHILQVQYNAELYEYEIQDIWITDADDLTVIVEKDQPTLTLTTCYPFNYIGTAPERYVIQAEKNH
ncbi:class D sortase [Alteribacter populi]|uniref:class D sortase n=1 Tax=Alteribacter populi TaxID=2011011 RepID=UPI000BBB4EF8|nr:class D sortase [Alteribacter populi]